MLKAENEFYKVVVGGINYFENEAKPWEYVTFCHGYSNAKGRAERLARGVGSDDPEYYVYIYHLEEVNGIFVVTNELVNWECIKKAEEPESEIEIENENPDPNTPIPQFEIWGANPDYPELITSNEELAKTYESDGYTIRSYMAYPVI